MNHQLGAHTVREEGSVLFLVMVGDFGAVEMQQLIAILERVVARHGGYGTIIDTRQLGSLTAEARRIVTKWPGIATCYGNAVFGEGSITRVMLTMAARAIQVLNSQRFSVAFVKTEAEARDWLKVRGESVGK